MMARQFELEFPAMHECNSCGRELEASRFAGPGGKLLARCDVCRAKRPANENGAKRTRYAINLRQIRRLPIAVEEPETQRPRTRGECKGGPRPCPWVSCRHHLYLSASGQKLELTWPDKEIDELEHTCSLDVADEGEHSLEEVGRALNVSRAWIQHIEATAGEKVRDDARLVEVVSDEEIGRRATRCERAGETQARTRVTAPDDEAPEPEEETFDSLSAHVYVAYERASRALDMREPERTDEPVAESAHAQELEHET